MAKYAKKFTDLIFEIFEILLSVTLGSVFVLFPIIILQCLNAISRFIISKILYIFHGDEITLNPTGYEGMFFYEGHKHGKRMILYLASLESPSKIESLQQSYLQDVLSNPSYHRLKKIWVKKMGYFCLKQDTNFNIKNHVKIYPGLENNPERIVTEDELMQEILPELSKDIPGETKPQWEDVLIPRFRYNKSDSSDDSIKSIRILRIHHSYADGLSTLMMLANAQSEGETFPWIINPLKPLPSQTTLKKIIYYTYCALKFSSTVAKHIIFTPIFMKHRIIAWKFTGESVYLWSKQIPMDVLRKIKNETGACMPAILCSILTSALRRFEEKFESSDPEFRGKISNEYLIGLVAALVPYPDLELRNQHSILKCWLDSRDLTRVERLRNVNEEIVKVSSSTDLYLGNLLCCLYGPMPAWFSDFFTSLMAGCGVVSNVPATGRRVKLWGNEVKEMAGWVPMLSPSGFGCVTLRYADNLRFCMNADKAAFTQEEMTFLVEAIAEEADLLAEECIEYKMVNKEVAAVHSSKANVKSRDICNNNRGRTVSRSRSTDLEDILRNIRLQRAIEHVVSSVKKMKTS